jgi:hypothetical protein
VLVTKTARRVQRPWPLWLFGEAIEWVETVRYLRVNLNTLLTCSSHVSQVRRKANQRLCLLSTLLNRRSGLSVRNSQLLYKLQIRPMMDYGCPMLPSAARTTSLNYKCCNRNVFTLRLTHPGTLVRCTSTSIWEFHFSPLWLGVR